MRTIRSLSILSILTVAVCLSIFPLRAQRALGDSRVIASVPATPGFPEGIAVRGNRFYVSAPANFGIFFVVFDVFVDDKAQPVR